MARRKGWRAVKSGLSYTVDEAARNQRVAKGTVLRWLKSGLHCIKDQRPYLILGGDLVAFLKVLNPPKHKCRPDQFFCFRCKAPRQPAFGEVEFRATRTTGGRLTALCVECSTVMHKSASLATLAALRATLRVSFPQGHEPISEGGKPFSNHHF